MGFCFVFASALIQSISQFHVTNARLSYYDDLITEVEYRNAQFSGNQMGFIASFLKITGVLLLSSSATAGAFFIEDKYLKIGLLVFSIITVMTLFTTYSS
jgi:hypothetical protein